MKLHHVFLLLGSNLGDRELHIRNAMKTIENEIGKAEKISSLYETEPWGVTNQPNYLNAVTKTVLLILQKICLIII